MVHLWQTQLDLGTISDLIDFFVRDTEEVVMHYGSIWVELRMIVCSLELPKTFLQYRLLVIVQQTSSVLYTIYFIVA